MWGSDLAGNALKKSGDVLVHGRTSARKKVHFIDIRDNILAVWSPATPKRTI